MKERCKPSKTLCAVKKKDSLPSLTILIGYLIEVFFWQLFERVIKLIYCVLRNVSVFIGSVY